jgi:hypothetical protein
MGAVSSSTRLLAQPQSSARDPERSVAASGAPLLIIEPACMFRPLIWLAEWR